MSTDYKLSETERRTLDDARRLLGDNLADFLLSGLGLAEISHRRAFAARSTSRHSWGVTYRFEMVNESGLAAGREPFVLAALLGLLQEGQPPEGGLIFRQCEILENLGWADATGSRKFVKQALEKYLLTAYCLVDETLPRGKRIHQGYAGFGRLLVSYETTSTPRPVYRIDPEKSARIHFPPGFIPENFFRQQALPRRRISETPRAPTRTPSHPREAHAHGEAHAGAHYRRTDRPPRFLKRGLPNAHR